MTQIPEHMSTPQTPVAQAAWRPAGGLLAGLAGLARRLWLGVDGPEASPPPPPVTPEGAVPVPLNAQEALAEALARCRAAGHEAVALLVELTTPGAVDLRLARIRLRAALRSGDLVADAADGRFLILSTLWRGGAEAAALRLARRMQAALGHRPGGTGSPCWIAAAALPVDPAPGADPILSTLVAALEEARASGPGTIRLVAMTPSLMHHAQRRRSLDGGEYLPPHTLPELDERAGERNAALIRGLTGVVPPAVQPPVLPGVMPGRFPGNGLAPRARTTDAEDAEAKAAQLAHAIEAGQFRAHFQPQLSADTGAITGFEALARWIHPEHGLLRPIDFMEDLERAGLLRRLGETMLTQSIDAMRIWSRAGYEVPSISVNVTHEELRDPLFATRLAWMLDRYELPPRKLILEVLETVAADPARAQIVQNLRAAVSLGCTLDLDDFGIGPGALDSLRDFPVQRIKIDRSFVTRCDHDPQQRKMLSAVLSMAERLDLQTVGEGVETGAEHSMLAQLGCDHVQGFSIARPMTLRETTLFIERQIRQPTPVPHLPRLQRRAGRGGA